VAPPTFRTATGSHGAAIRCAAIRCAADPPADTEEPSWRLAVRKVKDQSGREEKMLSLEPTDARWAARQIEVVLDASGGLGIELTE